jgi:S1-C subfamily serine protease
MKFKKLNLLLILCFFVFNVNAEERSANVKQASYSSAIKNASSSVVSLYASKSVANLADNVDAAIYGTTVNLKKENSLGSGVIVDKKGLIITNSHIVENSQDIKVVTVDNKSYVATVVDIDKGLDLAILQVVNSEQNFKAIEFADSNNLLVGDVVFALGNPFGVGQSASMGIISAIGRSFNIENADYLIQTDAAINPGNSGGALIDVDGKLIGLNSAMFSKTDSFSGVGFSVPSNALKFALDTLATNGSIQRAWLGAKGADISSNVKNALGLKNSDGVYITNVVEGSPAGLAGIKVGDVLVKLGKNKITNNNSLDSALKTSIVNQRMYAQVIREQRMLELEITLQTLSRRAESDKFMIRGNNMLSGLVVERLSPELNYMLNLKLDSKGIAIIDRPKSLADHNLQIGDVILKINKTDIQEIADLKSILDNPAPYGLKMTILRAGSQIKIFIK